MCGYFDGTGNEEDEKLCAGYEWQASGDAVEFSYAEEDIGTRGSLHGTGER